MSDTRERVSADAAATVLFVDNKKSDLDTWSKELREAGFKVVKAASPETARRALARGGIDMAVLDVRLRDDLNEDDQSGVELAEEIGGTLPVIMLARKPEWKTVRRSMAEQRGGGRLAVSFTAKADGPGGLIKIIREQLVPRVFVVHGQDDPARRALVSFFSGSHVRPILLAEQTGASRSIIERFEQYSNVKAAVILLTPDDVGSRRKAPRKLRPRPRQNVVFELGFFVAKLTRDRVIILCKEAKGGIEMPSDFGSVVPILFDRRGGWQIPLSKELAKAGIHINLHLGDA